MACNNDELKIFSSIVDTSLLISSEHIEKVRRLFLEALDIASFLCKTQLKHYGFSKIFDIILQIIPSAFVYNTSYWVFYAVNGKCICVCRRFKLPCRHTSSKNHWVDMDVVEEKFSDFFPNKFINPVICSTPVIEIEPVNVNGAYHFDVRCEVHIKNSAIQEVKYTMPQLYVENCKVFILGTRLQLFYEMEPADIATIIFDPHPQLLSVYGSYFAELQQSRVMRVLQMAEEDIPSTMIHLTPEAPRYTLYLSSDNFNCTYANVQDQKLNQAEINFLDETADRFSLLWLRNEMQDDNASSSDPEENDAINTYERDNAINKGMEETMTKMSITDSCKHN